MLNVNQHGSDASSSQLRELDSKLEGRHPSESIEEWQRLENQLISELDCKLKALEFLLNWTILHTSLRNQKKWLQSFGMSQYILSL